MSTDTDPVAMKDLDVLVGTWRMTASLSVDLAPAAEASFEWLGDKQFLVQRWRVDHPDAPDGIAVIGVDPDRAMLLQHYFDSRGVARVYDMTFTDGVWRLSRFAPGFCQRFTGRLSEDGSTITGSWEFSADGSTWEHDFDLTYTRTAQ
jgi:hypothetical protein